MKRRENWQDARALMRDLDDWHKEIAGWLGRPIDLWGRNRSLDFQLWLSTKEADRAMETALSGDLTARQRAVLEHLLTINAAYQE